MKQTAVEFISKGLFDILQEAENNNILEVGTQNFKRYIEMFEKQAKEMEKQQIIQFAKSILDKALDLDIRTAHSKVEEYYNETFKK